MPLGGPPGGFRSHASFHIWNEADADVPGDLYIDASLDQHTTEYARFTSKHV